MSILDDFDAYADRVARKTAKECGVSDDDLAIIINGPTIKEMFAPLEKAIEQPQSADAVDPHAASTGKLTTRA